MTAFAFAAYGIAGPQGSKNQFGQESSKKVKPWREAVKSAALDALPVPWEPLDGPLTVRMVFTLPRPKSAKRTDVAPYRYPDLSKLARSTEDALTEAGVWADDARVVQYERLAKVWWGFDAEALPFPGVIVGVHDSDGTPIAVDTYAVVLIAQRSRREDAS